MIGNKEDLMFLIILRNSIISKNSLIFILFYSYYRVGEYFTLSFCYEFEFNNDEVSFAYCIPYTYSKLINFIA